MPTESNANRPKTPIEVAERVAARSSAAVGALTAFCLFALIWLTAYAWLNDAPLDETNARRDGTEDSADGSGGRTESKQPATPARARALQLPPESRTGLRSGDWRDGSFFTRASSRRFVPDQTQSDPASAQTPHTFPLEPGTLAQSVLQPTLQTGPDPALPSPQTPVPLDETHSDTAPGTEYGVIVPLPSGDDVSAPLPGLDEDDSALADALVDDEAPFLTDESASASTDEALKEDAKSRMRADFQKLRRDSRGQKPPPRIATRGEDLPSGILAEDPAADSTSDLTATDDDGPAPNEEVLPSLKDELAQHAGGQMHRSLIDPEHDARLPAEGDSNPQPITAFQKFLGNDAVCPGGCPTGPFFANGNWGECGFTHERRLTLYGQYQVFGLAFEEAGQRFDGIGHSATFDVDFRLTGTERIHVQFQPVGRNDEGGSFWKLNDPRGYQDNSTIMPERYWIEGELYSLFSDEVCDEFTPRDWHIVAGKFPFVLHNELLLNDEILGLAVNSNTNMPGRLSNLNVQFFAGRDDTEPFDYRSTIAGIHASLDYQAQFYELTFARQWDEDGAFSDADYLAASATRFYGPVTIAVRALGRFDNTDDSSGLFVGEANWTRKLGCNLLEAEHLVAYATGFHATDRWQSIAGGDFDRLRSNFAVNPLVAISRQGTQADVSGAAVGVQIFRCHEDESWTPEFSFEDRDTGQVWAAGITFQRKLSRRWFMEFSGVRSWTNDPTLRDRTGLLLSTTWLL